MALDEGEYCRGIALRVKPEVFRRLTAITASTGMAEALAEDALAGHAGFTLPGLKGYFSAFLAKKRTRLYLTVRSSVVYLHFFS